MSYPEMEMWSHAIKPKSSFDTTAANLAAAAASYGGYYVLSPISLKRALFVVSTQVTSGTTNAVVQFLNATTIGTSSGALLAALTITNGATVGQTFYKDIADSSRVSVGNELMLYRSVQCADAATAAGAGFFGFIWEPAPDADANQLNLTKSA